MNDKIGQIVGVLALALWLSSPMRIVHLKAFDSEMETPQPMPLSQRSLTQQRVNEVPHSIHLGETEGNLPSHMQAHHADFQKTSNLRRVYPEAFLTKLTQTPPLRFAASAATFQPHESCKKSSAELTDSFRISMEETKLNVLEFIPETAHIVDLNYYFEYKGHYFQLSLEPIEHGARKYQLSLIRSPDPRFSTGVEKLPSPLNQSLPSILTHEEAIRGLRNLIHEYTEQGARWGSRSVLVDDSQVMFEEKFNSTQQKIPTRVEFHDGRVHGFMNHQQECHLAVNEILECMCW